MKLKVTPLSGGDEPKPKKTLLKSAPNPNIYNSQAEVDADMAKAAAFNKAHNLIPGIGISVGKVGDPKIQYRTLDGKPYTPQQMPASMVKGNVPDWVTELHMDDNWKMPYYKDGNDIVYVKKEFMNSPRFLKQQPTNPLQQASLLAKR